MCTRSSIFSSRCPWRGPSTSRSGRNTLPSVPPATPPRASCATCARCWAPCWRRHAAHETDLSRDLGPCAVGVAQVRSERESSWPVQFRRASRISTSSTPGSARERGRRRESRPSRLALLRAGAAETTLSGLMAAMAAPGSNRNPSARREDGAAARRRRPPRRARGLRIGDAASDGAGRGRRADQEGVVAQASFLPAKKTACWSGSVMRAVSATRFRPAQRHGSPVAVNLIWLFEQTTSAANTTARSDRETDPQERCRERRRGGGVALLLRLATSG